MMCSIVRSSTSVLALALALTFVGRASADDVFLKSGEKVTGTVFEDIPDQPVRLLLDDGSVRTVTRAELREIIYPTPVVVEAPKPKRKPAPKPPPKKDVGSLKVTSEEPGVVSARRVTKDGGRSTPTEWRELGAVSPEKPFSIDLPPSDYEIIVDFDDGGSDSAEVVIDVEHAKSVVAEGPAKLREGWTVWIGGGIPAVDVYFSDLTSLYGTVSGSFRLLLAGTTDLRLGAELGFGAAGDPTGTPVVLATVSGGMRFGLGSVYGLEAGLRLGGTFFPDATVDSEVFRVGPSWSVLSFQMGSLRNIELALQQGIDLLLLPGYISSPIVTPVYHQNLSLAVRLP